MQDMQDEGLLGDLAALSLGSVTDATKPQSEKQPPAVLSTPISAPTSASAPTTEASAQRTPSSAAVAAAPAGPTLSAEERVRVAKLEAQLREERETALFFKQNGDAEGAMMIVAKIKELQQVRSPQINLWAYCVAHYRGS